MVSTDVDRATSHAFVCISLSISLFSLAFYDDICERERKAEGLSSKLPLSSFLHQLIHRHTQNRLCALSFGVLASSHLILFPPPFSAPLHPLGDTVDVQKAAVTVVQLTNG